MCKYRDYRDFCTYYTMDALRNRVTHSSAFVYFSMFYIAGEWCVTHVWPVLKSGVLVCAADNADAESSLFIVTWSWVGFASSSAPAADGCSPVWPGWEWSPPHSPLSPDARSTSHCCTSVFRTYRHQRAMQDFIHMYFTIWALFSAMETWESTIVQIWL